MWDHKGKQYLASPFLFMMAHTYILYSQKLDSFYIGACHEDLSIRIINHNNGRYGRHRFTSRASDWVLFLQFEVGSYAHAIRLERKIKSMKSRKYIMNLSKYPELREKIINETKSI
ncbi:GIY-YIG nuclease family protein [Aequorivita capsosiphonis]|uniref:GIY-YIG nuclease family protein n=1 Tax=Aequorivita capsosiphonis TaxID=487317 RepID=UPI0009FE1DE3|nr:GIY-YIG nuclease family protein [Aequorivita capsosiphonis]